jgi:hypothetical protein
LNFQGQSLGEVAAAVSNHLRSHGIEVAVVGGSAITLHVPDVYTSHDIDLAILTGFDRPAAAKALRELGFSEDGREFVNPTTPFSVDLVAATPYIDQRPIRQFDTIPTAAGPVRAYFIEDALADRIAAWLYWADSQSLEVAERVASAARSRISQDRLESSLAALSTGDRVTEERMRVARDRLQRALAK